MVKLHYLRLLMRDQEKDLIFQVSEADSERLRECLSGLESQEPGFFWFDTMDRRAVVVNLNRLQGARFLWEAGTLVPAEVPGGIQIKLIGRAPVVEDYTEHPEDIFDLFTNLDAGYSMWPSFEDQDGEMFTLQASEIEWIIAPKSVLDEGEAVARGEQAD